MYGHWVVNKTITAISGGHVLLGNLHHRKKDEIDSWEVCQVTVKLRLRDFAQGRSYVYRTWEMSVCLQYGVCICTNSASELDRTWRRMALSSSDVSSIPALEF